MNQIHQGKGKKKKNTEILKPKGFICLGNQQQHQAKPNTPPKKNSKTKTTTTAIQIQSNLVSFFPPSSSSSSSSTSFFGFLQKPAVSARTGQSKHEISSEDVGIATDSATGLTETSVLHSLLGSSS
jgi:hypothetical protein